MSEQTEFSTPEETPVVEPVFTAIPEEGVTTEERTWALLAHLSIFVNLFTGLLGTAAALVIYLIYKDKSKYVAYQSLQALIFQLVFFLGGGLLIGLVWTITGLLSIILIGLILIPFALIFSLLPIGCLAYAIYAAVETYHGKDFKYWLVGDWTRSTLTN
ncbi:MAG TPA: DUF4870 domain-containing protein [Anaerolineaceae bacterium]|jgi:uncharacterized Tic20 family protein|nr:DUF4870 domain-containing protein [Anaerolineaceae bacterium]HOA21976.1 DUF4870 domain-containing protein [Anaerolineaceae bacterium]HOG77487.1 DUF4870 domain-containing protein [Anaerolineaceae bacterium]